MQKEKLDKIVDRIISIVIIGLMILGSLSAGYYLLDMVLNGLGG